MHWPEGKIYPQTDGWDGKRSKDTWMKLGWERNNLSIWVTDIDELE